MFPSDQPFVQNALKNKCILIIIHLTMEENGKRYSHLEMQYQRIDCMKESVIGWVTGSREMIANLWWYCIPTNHIYFTCKYKIYNRYNYRLWYLPKHEYSSLWLHFQIRPLWLTEMISSVSFTKSVYMNHFTSQTVPNWVVLTFLKQNE